ncbi:MAG: hypothetical protein QRY74_03870 [Chlamydia sp.]
MKNFISFFILLITYSQNMLLYVMTERVIIAERPHKHLFAHSKPAQSLSIRLTRSTKTWLDCMSKPQKLIYLAIHSLKGQFREFKNRNIQILLPRMPNKKEIRKGLSYKSTGL